MNSSNSNGYHNNANHSSPNRNQNNAHNGNGHSTQPQMQTNQKSSPSKPPSSDQSNLEAIGKQTWDALQKLHAPNTSNEERTSADRFLSKVLPNQPVCWQIFAKFLTTDNIPHQAHFFAANMLRSKIQRNLHQVPLQHHQGLHDMILTSLINFNKKGTQYENVRTQLSIALALLAIQRTDWTNEVSNLITKLAQTETLDILLNILTRLAEELYTFHIPISSKVKHKASNILRKHASLVLKLLHDLFQMVSNGNGNGNHRIVIKLKIFKCFAAWLDFMDTHFQDFMTNYTVLTKICFDSLSNDELFKDSCTCISKILRLSDGDSRSDKYYYDEDRDKDSEQKVQENMDELMRKQFNILVPNIIALKAMYIEYSQSEESKDKCYGLCRLFVDCGEHYCDWLMSDGNIGKELINILLLCSENSDPIISTYVCIFWEKLLRPFLSIVRELKYSYQQRTGDTVDELCDEFERVWPDWCLPYVNLENGLIIRVCRNTVLSAQLAKDFCDLDIDEQEELLNIRWQNSDIIEIVCNILGLFHVFDILYKMLSQNIQRNNNDMYECEAILFCVRSSFKSEVEIYEMNNSKKAHPLYKIYQLLPAIMNKYGSNNEIISKQCISFIHIHCGFISPQSDLEIFTYLYSYIFQSLSMTELSHNAVRAIREICDQKKVRTQDFPQNFIISLFEIYSNENQTLVVSDELVLIESIAILVSKFTNVSDMKQGIDKLLNKQMKRLSVILNSNANNANTNSQNETLYETMNCISCIFKYFHPSKKNGNIGHGLNVLLLERIWPTIKQIFLHYTECDGIMEKTTRIIKHCMRNHSGNNQTFMNCKVCLEILKLITDLYCTKSQRSCFLYTVWIYVEEYIEINDSAAQELIATLQRISQCTFEKSLLDSDKAFIDNADIVEDYYELLIQYIKKSNQRLIANKNGIQFLYLCFKKAQFGICINNHYKAHFGICNFYTEFLYHIPTEICDQILFGENNCEYAKLIIYKILYGIAIADLRYDIVTNLVDLLNEFYKFNKHKFELIIRNILLSNHFKSIQCSDPTKEEFINDYFNHKYDSKKRYKIAFSFYYACERYLRSKTF